jgi:hypothetical protein
MKPAAKTLLALSAIAAIAGAFVGCGDVGVGVGVSGGYTPVYGDYGYVGGWDNPGVDYEGAYLASPPYSRYDRDHREVPDHGAPAPRAEPERNRPAEPARGAVAPHPEPRPIPSIPNHPRPAQPQSNGRNDERKRN